VGVSTTPQDKRTCVANRVPVFLAATNRGGGEQVKPAVRDAAVRDKSRLLASLGNRVVVGLLSNWRTALASEPFTKNVLDSIGDDRVLNHAYRVLGGRPEIALEVVNDLVPEDLRRRLSAMSTPSAD
jgi:hypothetical protein